MRSSDAVSNWAAAPIASCRRLSARKHSKQIARGAAPAALRKRHGPQSTLGRLPSNSPPGSVTHSPSTVWFIRAVVLPVRSIDTWLMRPVYRAPVTGEVTLGARGSGLVAGASDRDVFDRIGPGREKALEVDEGEDVGDGVDVGMEGNPIRPEVVIKEHADVVRGVVDQPER